LDFKTKSNFAFLKEEGQKRTSILLGKWNHEKHIEWINTTPPKKSDGNVRERQYGFSLSIIYVILF